MGLRVLASYDRPNITADHVSWARRIIDSHGGKTVAGIEAALRTVSTYDNTVPRQVIQILRWHLTNARARQEKARNLMWRPMR